jgi:hypothetical protein
MKLFTVTEAAAVKGVTKQAINAAIKAGRLTTVTVHLPAIRIEDQALERLKVNVNKQRSGRPRKQEAGR